MRENEQTKWAVGIVVLIVTAAAALYAQRVIAGVELAFRHEESMVRIEKKIDWLIRNQGQDPEKVAYATP